MAFESFYGRCIYDGCCRMELILGQIISDANKRQIPIEDVKPVEKFMTVNPSRSEVPMNIGYSQVVASIDSTQQVKASLQQQLPDSQLHFEVHQATRELLKESSGDSFKVSEMQTRRSQEICQTELPDSSIETKQLDFDSVTSPTIGTCFESFGEPFSEMLEIEEHARASFGPTTTDIVESWVLRETWDLDIDKDIEESQIPSASLKNMAKLVDEPFGSIALSWADFKVSSFGFLADSSAHNMFDEIPGAQGGHRLDVLNVSTTPLPSRDGNCAKVNYLTGINTHSLLEFRNSIARSRYFESDVKYAGNVARSVSIISRYAGDDGVGTLSFDPGGQPSRKLTEHCLDLFSHGGPLLKFNAPIEASCLLLNSTQDTNSLIDKNCRIESLKFDLEGGFMINVSAEVWEISGESHTLGSHLLDLNATVYAYWKPRGDDLIMSEGPVQIETRDELNEMLPWFLERFADPDVFNRYKQTPLC